MGGLNDKDGLEARFRLRQTLGQGAHGIVYEADDLERGERVALKRLRALTPEALYRFKNEFRSVATLRHPNLVRMHELLSVDGEWYLSMDVVDGDDFVAWVRGDVRGRLRDALRQLAAGVLAIHADGKLHRDLKPSNIRVGADGRVTILDFGLAVAWGPVTPAGATLERTGDVVGTPIYMSPEQAAGGRAAQASDWYSVGVILFESLTGRWPFSGGVMEVLAQKQAGEPPDPRSEVPGLPDDLAELCLRLMRHDPTARPTGEEIARLLEVEAAAPEAARDAPFVGRARELEVLDEALRASRDGKTVIVHVRGASGIGKSALATQFLALARSRHDALALRGQCFERESVPYRAIDSLVDALVKHLATLPRAAARRLAPSGAGALVKLFPVLAATETFKQALPASGDPHTVRRHGFAALRELFARLAEERALVIHLDDLQWGDLDSAELLADVLRAPGAPPLLLVVSYRAGDETRSPVVAALRRLGEGVDLDVGPLDAAAGAELARELLHARGVDDDAAVAWIARESEGRPFFVEELSRHAAVGETHPVSLRTLLAERVAALAPEPRRFLETVATAGGPVRFDVAARAAGLAGGAATEAAALLDRACLTRAAGSLAAKEIETFHDRIRELVVELLGDDERRARHRALAEAIEAFGGGRDDEDDAALAMHWLAAGERERAARHSEGAALRAEAALAFDQAASLLRQALELSAPSEARRLQALLGDALARAGKSREAATALLAAVDGADAEQALALQRRAAEQLLRGGHLADGAEVIRRALASVGLAYPATPRRALAALLWRRGRLRWRGLDFVERPAASIAPELLARLDMCWAAGQGLGYTDMVRGMGFQSRHLQLALDAGDPYRVVRGIGVEAIFVASTGDAKQAAALVERAAALAERTGRPECRVWVELGAAMTALCAYRWPEALAAAERVPVLAAGHEADMRWEISTGQYVSLLALLYSGRVAEVARRVPEAFAEAEDRGDLYTEATLGTYPQPWFLVAQDRPDEAQAALDHAVVRWCNEGFHLQHLGHFLATAELQLYRGDAAAAVDGLRRGWRAMERSQLLRVRFLGVRAREILGRAAAASAGGPDDPILGESERMARWLEREGSAWTRLLATLIRGLIAQRRGDDALALARFEEAERGADACKSALHAAALRRQRGVLAGLGDLVAGADDDMRAMGVRAPARYADMLVPLAARRTASS